MKLTKPYNRALIFVIAFSVIVVVFSLFVFISMSKWEEEMVERNKSLCQLYAEGLYQEAMDDIAFLFEAGHLTSEDLSSASIKQVDSVLKRSSNSQLSLHEGLDGGFYLVRPDAFFGYSFPTSPPPVPVYGPPPRSFEIIKTQALRSIYEGITLVDLHGFDAAVFPLATIPIVVDSQIAGAVWVRIHLEKHLPVVKIRTAINRTAIISIAGFFLLMLLSALWGDEMKSIKRELENISKSRGYRLKKRWGIFGYISSTVNEMLQTIDSENDKRQKLESELFQKEKLASLGTMVAGVAHEVKTPLSIIKTRMQIWQKALSDGNSGNNQVSTESMQMVISETNRLVSLVNRLLIFSRPIENKLKPTEINSLVSEVIALLNLEVNEKSVAIEVRSDSNLPSIPLDYSSIKQVLINIIQNSVDSIEREGTITITTSSANNTEYVTVEVEDSGIGIPEEALSNIFDPFFTLKENGVGLGLAISYQIVKAHGGEISIKNRVAGGVSCLVKLPAYKID
jgi:signal transduction histidine kinase